MCICYVLVHLIFFSRKWNLRPYSSRFATQPVLEFRVHHVRLFFATRRLSKQKLDTFSTTRASLCIRDRSRLSPRHNFATRALFHRRYSSSRAVICHKSAQLRDCQHKRHCNVIQQHCAYSSALLSGQRLHKEPCDERLCNYNQLGAIVCGY